MDLIHEPLSALLWLQDCDDCVHLIAVIDAAVFLDVGVCLVDSA